VPGPFQNLKKGDNVFKIWNGIPIPKKGQNGGGIRPGPRQLISCLTAYGTSALIPATPGRLHAVKKSQIENPKTVHWLFPLAKQLPKFDNRIQV
jgi:hypothetical protein